MDPCMLPAVRLQVDKIFSEGSAWLVWLCICLPLGLSLFGCDISSDDQRCIPVSQSGCSRGEICTVDVDGAPTCVAVESGTAREGAACKAPLSETGPETMDTCGPGLACIHHQGVDRCLRFCDPESEEIQTACQTGVSLDDGASHRYSEWSQCDLVLAGRPDIAVCSLPCSPGERIESDCPEDHRCAIPSGDQIARCQSVGLARSGQACGASCRCGDGFQCVSEGQQFVCRPFALDGACEEGLISPLIGTQNPMQDGAPYRICRPCQSLELGGMSLCETGDICTDDFGIPASPSEDELSSVARLIFRLQPSLQAVILGAEILEDQTWAWPGQSLPIEAELWEGGLNPTGGQCVILKPSGLLSTAEDCQGYTLCAPSIRPSCGAP